MLGIQAIPAFIYTMLVLRVPESPRWLLAKKNNRVEAEKVLTLIDPSSDVKHEADMILRESTAANTKSDSIFKPKYKTALWLAFFIAFFNQFSGINAFLYYAPRIFNLAGLEDSAALLSSAGIGFTNLIFTLIGVAWIDKYGRKQLLYYGSFGYILSLAAVALAFYFNLSGWIVTIALFVFIASHAIGQGSVIWVFISEIFPNHLRADGQSFGCSVHWILAAAIPSSIPYLFDSIGAATVFLVFTLMMIGQLIWVWKFMPETKGISLEALSSKLVKG
jgi:MFS family permease